MSSEMRELMQSVLDFVNRQPCRCMSIAQLGERDYCDRCQSVKNLRALLARTEAGADGACAKHGAMWAKGCAACDRDLDQMPGPPDASPVADGAVAWGVEVDGGFDYVSTIMTSVENEAAFYGPEHTIRIIPLYLHPQDASGDAELLDWLVENEFDLVTRREDMGEDEYAIWWFVIDSRKSSPWRLHTVSGHPLGSPREAIIAAMQAKEAKS